jgi:hypothetical protein
MVLVLLRISGLCLAGFVLAVVGEHALEPSLSPVRSVISEYARTGAGDGMRLGFAAWAVSIASLACVTGRLGRRVVAAGLAVGAVGDALVCAFTTQAVEARVPEGVARTLTGRLHDVGGELLIGGLSVAVMATARGPEGRRALLPVAVAGVLSVVLLATGDPMPGLRQRVVVAGAVAWQALLLRHLVSKQRTFSMQYQLMPEQRPSQPVNGGSPGATSSTSFSRIRRGSRSKSSGAGSASRGPTGTS